VANSKVKVLFLGLNHDEIPYLLELKKRNFIIIGIDRNKSAPGIEFCDSYYNVGYDQLDKLIDVGEKELFCEHDLVFTAASQFAHKGAARFAKRFSITYPAEESIDICLDKVKFYKSFEECGLIIPKTYFIKTKEELELQLNDLDKGWYYLKSDFSKNPNYVYRFNSHNTPYSSFNWKKDRYLQHGYVLQQEFNGKSLRLNLYGERFNVFDFKTNNKVSNEIIDHQIIKSLKQFRDYHNMESWLLKFDLIINKDSYVALDVGMEPPMRMLNFAKSQSVNFESHYIDQYIFKNISYPNKLD